MKKPLYLNQYFYRFYLSIKTYYMNKTEENLNNVLLTYLDDEKNPKADNMYILRYVLSTQPENKAISLIFYGEKLKDEDEK